MFVDGFLTYSAARADGPQQDQTMSDWVASDWVTAIRATRIEPIVGCEESRTGGEVDDNVAAMRLLFFVAVLGALMSGTAAVVNGPAGRLNVVEHGAGGVPVLFIHSLAGNARQWQAQVDHAARSRRAIAMDLRGHGHSEYRAPAGVGPADHADDIRAVLDR